MVQTVESFEKNVGFILWSMEENSWGGLARSEQRARSLDEEQGWTELSGEKGSSGWAKAPDS